MADLDDEDDGTSQVLGESEIPSPKKLSASVIEYRLQTIHRLYKELRQEIKELKRDLKKWQEGHNERATKLAEKQVQSDRRVDRFDSIEKGREAIVGYFWMAVMGGIVSLIVGLIVYAMMGNKPGP